MTNTTVLLVGKPNSGKSLLFNRLTGLHQKVSNFPGATVSIQSGEANGLTYVDHPGIYSLDSITSDEKVSLDALKKSINESFVKLIVCVLDLTRLEASVNLGLRIKNLAMSQQKTIVFALNMIDELPQNLPAQMIKELELMTGAPVFPISAKTESGIPELKEGIQRLIDLSSQKPLRSELPSLSTTDIHSQVTEIVKKFGLLTPHLLKRQVQLDHFFLSTVFGGLVFGAIMLILFQSIFSWSAPLMDGVESLVSALGEISTSHLPDGWLKDFLVQAIFNGVGAFLVFVPQIFMLTFMIGILEDSGYLARASIICHKPLSLFGLDGKSFVPYLSGHACAIPAILASRTIDSPRRRLLTILTIPLTVCSARLPVYSLIIAAVIPAKKFFGGLIGLQGLSLFLLYGFGIFMALIAAALLSKLSPPKNAEMPFILELPPYRLPNWRPLFRKSLSSAFYFIKNAGLVILVTTVLIWAFGYFPNGSGHLEDSWLASIGKFIEPIFSNIGLDWKFAVAILTSFVAREVFVGTLGTLFGIQDVDNHVMSLADRLSDVHFSLPSGIALLVFYGIALQCISTVATINRETNKPLLGWSVMALYGMLAYLLAWAAYRLVSMF